jgi:hypothetical protein
VTNAKWRPEPKYPSDEVISDLKAAKFTPATELWLKEVLLQQCLIDENNYGNICKYGFK